MASSISLTLDQFNQHVLQCQDDAYTLAWYLLGDEAKTKTVIQAAIKSSYRCFAPNRTDCLSLILKQVVNQCRGQNLNVCGSSNSGILQGLHFLTEQERVVLVLIDVLRLDYPETACVTGSPLKKIGTLLAQARRKMKVHMKFAEPGGQ